MPYETIQELPYRVRNHLPEHAQEIFLNAFNSAYDQYKDPKNRKGNASLEETANKVAWSAVKQEYKKDSTTGEWKKK